MVSLRFGGWFPLFFPLSGLTGQKPPEFSFPSVRHAAFFPPQGSLLRAVGCRQPTAAGWIKEDSFVIIGLAGAKHIIHNFQGFCRQAAGFLSCLGHGKSFIRAHGKPAHQICICEYPGLLAALNLVRSRQMRA